jgi:small ligand-binding sensory domain FIST
VGLSQGCAPIGPVRTVSEAAGNMIMTIDGRPALEAFCEDIGEELARDLRRVGGRIFVAFPVAGSDTGDYVVRSLTAIDPAQGWLGVGALPEPGQPIMFCRRDQASARQDLERMLGDLRRRSNAPPKAGLYFSCLARGRNLFGTNSEELEQVRRALGDFPLAGFFANGEVSHDRLYGYTGVLVLFS